MHDSEISNPKFKNGRSEGEFPSDRPFLNFGLEIPESCNFEFFDFPIPYRTCSDSVKIQRVDGILQFILPLQRFLKLSFNRLQP